MSSTPRLQSASPLRRPGPLRITLPSRRGHEAEQVPDGTEKRRANLRIVPRLRRRRAGAVAVAVCVAVFGVMLGLVAFQAKIAADQQRLDKVEQDTGRAQTEYERLRVIVAQLESPYNVISSAEANGMVLPDKVTYVTPSVGDVAAVTSASGRVPADPNAPKAPDSTSAWESVKPYVGAAP